MKTPEAGTGTAVVKKTETLPVTQQQSPIENMMTLAIEKGITAETMEKFIAMRNAELARIAKAEYDNAMADLQSELPVIEKIKNGGKTDAGIVAYKFADLGTIVEQVGALIGEHGFSYSFKTENTKDRVKVTCIVKHRAGHTEESTMETDLGNRTKIMSGPQQIAGTVTFNKRYAFVNAFGITTGDEDLDDNAPKGPVLADDSYREEVDTLAEAKGLTKAELAHRFRAKYKMSITEMTAVQAQGVIASLKTMPNKATA